MSATIPAGKKSTGFRSPAVRAMLAGSAAFVFAVPAAVAQTANWTGAGGDNQWFTAGNWNTNAVPDGATNVVIGGSSAVQIGQTGAAAASITLTDNSNLTFQNAASAGQLTISALNQSNPNGTSGLVFAGTSSAGQATINLGGTGTYGDFVGHFGDNSNAGSATITVSAGAEMGFYDTSSAAQANLIANSGGIIGFEGSSDAGTAHVTNNTGGLVIFANQTTADSATIVNNAGGQLDLTFEDASFSGNGAVSIGSLSGAGNIYLGSASLTLGGLGANDTISGAITDGTGSLLVAYVNAFAPGFVLPTLAGGSLTKIGGGTLTLTGIDTYTGGTTISAGTLAVTGTGKITASNGLADNATLAIAGGGTVNINGVSTIDNGGSANVSGAGSAWTNSSDLVVGQSATGSLSILAGGMVSNNNGYAGADGTGTVTVSGSSNGVVSTWTNSGQLFVGDTGTGTLNILAGGTVSNTFGIIGNQGGSNGTVLVSGTDGNGHASTWTSSAQIYVGDSGTGTLTVQDGG